MSDMATCDLPDLVVHLRKAADKCGDANDFLRCLLMNALATRFQNCHERIEELEITMERLHIDVQSEVEITRNL